MYTYNNYIKYKTLYMCNITSRNNNLVFVLNSIQSYKYKWPIVKLDNKIIKAKFSLKMEILLYFVVRRLKN